MNYLVGDVQGCCGALDRLLAKIDFSASRDHLYVLGDMVNRGPQSLQTLERLRGLGASATCLLGNHDLNLLAVAQGVRRTRKGDTIEQILDSPDRQAWLEWLRHRRMAVFEQGWLMVHAGVVPQWDADQTLALAGEVEALLRSNALSEFLPLMYGDEPAVWSEDLCAAPRWRFIINVLTRTRFVSLRGQLDLTNKDGAAEPGSGLLPWFEVPDRRTRTTPMAFGHWATLGLIDRPNVLGLDTGCVWGRRLTAARIDGTAREFIHVDCG